MNYFLQILLLLNLAKTVIPLALSSIVPSLYDCPAGRRFVVGYIMYICQVDEEKKLRSFKPFGN